MTVMTNRVLRAVALLEAAIAVLSFTPVSRLHQRRPAETTAFLNARYVATVAEFCIEQKTETLTLKRLPAGNWLGTNGSIIFPVDSERMERFIAALTTPRKLYLISSRVHALERYELDTALTTTVSYRNNMNSYTKVDFGNQNSITARRRCMIAGRTGIYETADDIAPFLSVRANDWADPYLVSPVMFGTTTAEDIQSISFTSDGTATYLTSGTAAFSAAVRTMLSLRHGALVPISQHGETTDGARLVMGKGDGSAIYVSFAPRADGGQTVMLSAPSGATSSAPAPFSYAVEISAWTYERIAALFK
ncbi:MAG: DUF4340 domain-containing protein [Treponema sp.]|nr:DUF4340 domain-containing protein [Treponema sp.]